MNEKDAFFQQYHAILQQNNITPSGEIDLAGRFFHLLLEANQRVNLTGYRSLEDMVDFNLLDAIAFLRHAEPPNGASLIDVGAGGGLPGVPIACLRPDLRVTMIDSIAKKIAFIQSACEELELSNVTAEAARAEEYVRLPGKRASFDVAFARGLSSLGASMEYCAPLVKTGGQVILLRGAEEMLSEEADRFQKTLGCRFDRAERYVLPRRDKPFCVVFYQKIAAGDRKFPRMPVQIKTRPL
ncbi:MAG: 16S rRNA (guanine(527)-N(7))-methyltransferase RsmG [bacterium]|nr:16S rRNA (guanine(527)-N(7))-methyltransferase RsmG [bacterium]